MRKAVAQPVQQLQEQLPCEAVMNVDETGWRTNGHKRWIWTLVAQQFVFYVVASTRGAEVLVSLLGAVFRGILCSDRWVVYLTYHSGRIQLCWAHLKRNLLGIAEYARSPSAAVLPGRLGDCGPALPSLVSVSRKLAGPARQSPTD
jgi:transposase